MAQGVRSQPPVRHPTGFTQEPPWGPLAQIGIPHPFFYHFFEDDFDQVLAGTGLYTITASGGSFVLTPGDGGLALATTGATANEFASAQVPIAGFQLPLTGSSPPGSSTDTRKMAYLARVEISLGTGSLIAGLCEQTTTPFTTGVSSVTDGLFFYKPPTSNVLELINIASAANSPSGSAFTTTFTLPVSIVPGTFIDLAWFVDSQQNIHVWAGLPLVGYVPQSGTGSTLQSNSIVSAVPIIGPLFVNYNFVPGNTSPLGTPQTNPQMFSTANLTPTLAVCNGTTAAATTAEFDFHFAAKER